jgi:cytochrome c556
MNRRAGRLLLGMLLPLAAACRAPAPEAGDAPRETDSAVVAAEPEHVHDDAAASGPEAGAAGGEAHDALPLKPIMQQLATAMAGLTQALWTEDYAAMAGHAERVAGHTLIAPEEMRRIRTTLGAETARFNAADESVHHASLQLLAAVRARDGEAILARLAEVQQGCVACHTEFRQRLATARP